MPSRSCGLQQIPSLSTADEKFEALCKVIMSRRCPPPEDLDALKALDLDRAPGCKQNMLDALRPSPENRGHDLFWGMGETLLHIAARVGNVDAAKLLLRKGAGINVVSRPSDACPGTALHVACASGSTAVVQLLLEARADRRPVKCGAGSALHIACDRGHVEIVELLVNR